MKTYTFNTLIEDFICRTPSMFAYIEFNDDWTYTIHPAVDSYNGSYGKIVENIAVPCGVWLCSYVQILSEPENYVWTNDNTFPSGTNMDENYSLYSDEYARRVENCVYNDSEFDETAEYTVLDELPTEVTYISPANVKIAQKDENGEVVVDCEGNVFYSYYRKECEYTYYKKECFVVEGETYTYRTLIDYYYRFKNTLPEDDPFISFMSRGIGVIDVDKKSIGLEDEDKYKNVPEKIYLGSINSLISKYSKYHRLCDYYKTHFIDFGKTDESLEKKCEYYESIGGDIFLKFLKKLTDVSNRVSSEYLCYANNRSHDLQISLNIPLLQSKNDLGYLSTHINEFIPGEQYRHGELLTYNGRTYICLLNRFMPNGRNYSYVLCNGVLYKQVLNTYQEVETYAVIEDELPLTYNGHSCIVYNDKYYLWGSNGYTELDVTKYCTGVWDEEESVMKFDEQHFVLLSEYIGGDEYTLSIPEKKILQNTDGWYCDTNTFGNKFKIYIELPYLPSKFIYHNIKCSGVFYIWDNENQMYVVDTDLALSYMINGSSESVLRTLRGYSDYINANGFVDEPPIGEDWLYYYRIGTVNANGSILWDKLGNIRRFNNYPVSVNDYVTDLMAYGNILTNIECDADNKTLTFTYVINAHLKAVLKNITYDNDGNEIYCYSPFEYDENDEHGVVYTETHTYDDPDIDLLYNNGDFEAYVSGGNIVNFMTNYGYKKFIFKSDAVLSTFTIGGYSYDRPIILSLYEEKINNDLDYIYQPVFKKDYFTGYSYEPTVKSSIDIKRGNAASYERHIRLGDNKTLDDLTSTGFYSFSE